MKIKRLYIKILLSFAGVLVITEILFLGLFVVTIGRTFRQHVKERTISKMVVFRSIVEEKVNRRPDIPLSEREDIKEFFNIVSSLLDVNIRLSDHSGNTVLQTSGIPEMPLESLSGKEEIIHENIRIIHQSRHRLDFYAEIPLDLPSGNTGMLHIRFNGEKIHKPEIFFLLGMLLIAVIIAILVVPLSRIITRRVNQLNTSALQLAAGELSCRTRICGKDEIAKLGESFNFMADRIEDMIHKEKELTANISHELRSPLARIRISKEILFDRLKKKKEKDLCQYLDIIEDDIRMLDKLIGDILKMSKSDMTEQSLKIEPVDMSDMLSRLVEKFRPAMDHQQLHLELSVQDHLTVNGDRDGLVSVLSNILDNAVKYTPVKGKIIINAFRDADQATAVDITNTARQFSQEEHEQVFRPFFRRKDTIASGSGLGLHIARTILERHQATICVINTNNGVMFKMVFPPA